MNEIMKQIMDEIGKDFTEYAKKLGSDVSNDIYRIYVKHITSPFRMLITDEVHSAVSIEDARALFEKIDFVLFNRHFPCNVALDFEEIPMTSLGFLQETVGKLYLQYGPKTLEGLISYENMNEEDRTLLTQVIENACRIFDENNR